MTTKQLTIAGVLAALVFIATLLIAIPIPTGYGYLHLGDTFVYLCGALMGPIGAFPAAIGSLLADIAAGYAMYAVPTFIIKGLDAFVVASVLAIFKKKTSDDKLQVKHLSIAALFGGIVMVTGYFFTESLLLGYGFAVAIANVFPNAVQAVGGMIIFVLLYFPLQSVIKKMGVI